MNNLPYQVPFGATFLILTPASPQACAIARCFAAGGWAGRYAFGELVESECLTQFRLSPSPGQSEAIVADALQYFEGVVPTGSLDTATMLRRFGDIRVGEITMATSSLRWFDKSWSLALSESAGVAIPRTWDNAALIPAHAGSIFYKPGREGVLGARTWVKKPSDLPRVVKAPGSGFIFQEMIPGKEVLSYGFLADRGKIIEGAGLAERVSYPPHGGGAVVMELISDDELRKSTETLVRASSYSGWGLAEFKRCPRRNKLVLMEINPKFWASFELVLRTQPAFAKRLFGLTVAAEPITKMWWPSRMAMLGIDHWPKHIFAIKGATVAAERISKTCAFRALLPYKLQEKISSSVRAVRTA